jgi:leucine dehydrogenase
MEVKHMAYNTGCAGAKVVCNIGSAALADIDKQTLLDKLNDVLVSLEGRMYTGCDLNSTLEDMEYLSRKSPYILAAIGNDKVDPNHATAHGVVGGVIAVLRPDLAKNDDGEFCIFNKGNMDEAKSRAIATLLEGKTCLVHGSGAVGSVVASELAAMGATVYTLDTVVAKADIVGCKNISGRPEAKEWWRLEVDAIVPCSSSGLISPAKVAAMNTQAIVGASNLPFDTAATQHFAESVGGLKGPIAFIPEGVTSAGAVIVDSVEQYDPSVFASAKPNELYAFCRQAVFSKTAALKKLVAAGNNTTASKEMPTLLAQTVANCKEPIGLGFREWKDAKATHPATAVMSSNALASFPGAQARIKVQMGQHARAMSSRASSKRSMSTLGRRTMSTSAAWKSADVAICGAGIMGLNIAYHLKSRDPGMRVVVLEKAPGLGHGMSGWSTGFLRAFYSVDDTMRLALDGIRAYKNWGEYTGIKDPRAFFTETGALWMLGKSQAENDAMKLRLASFGVKSDVLDAEGIRAKFPTINTDPYPEYNLETGEIVEKDWGPNSALYEYGCGHLDSSACLEDMLEACQREGVEVHFKTGVDSVMTEGGKATGVKLSNGRTISAGAVVNCMGPWFQNLNKTVGVTTSTTMLATRIQVGHVNVESEDLLNLPFTADQYGNSGVYFMPRRANKQLVFGSIDHRFESEIIENPDDFQTGLDKDVEQDYMSCLLHRLTTLPTRYSAVSPLVSTRTRFRFASCTVFHELGSWFCCWPVLGSDLDLGSHPLQRQGDWLLAHVQCEPRGRASCHWRVVAAERVLPVPWLLRARLQALARSRVHGGAADHRRQSQCWDAHRRVGDVGAPRLPGCGPRAAQPQGQDPLRLNGKDTSTII